MTTANNRRVRHEALDAITAWVTADHPAGDRETLAALCRLRSVHDDVLAHDLDRETFEALPNRITIFRGVRPHGRAGWSWTFDENIAAFFAFIRSTSPTDVGTVIEAEVEKRDVIAFIDRAHRCEREI